MGAAAARHAVDIDEFLLSAWRVSKCDRRRKYGYADYRKRIHRLRPGDAPGAPVRYGGAETPPDVGFVGEDYKGVLLLGMRPGLGEGRGLNEREYFAEAVEFSKAECERSALRIGRHVLAEERRMADCDPWPLHDRMRPLLDRVSLTFDHVARLNVARSKIVGKYLTRSMAETCFAAHAREQISILAPCVIVCCFKGAHGWLRKCGADIADSIPVAVVCGRKPSHEDMEIAAATVEEALANCGTALKAAAAGAFAPRTA